MSRTLVIGLTLASMLTAIAGLAIGFDKGHSTVVQLLLMLATAVPYVAILLFAYTGAWPRAYSLAMGTATVAFLGLILFAGILTLFAGFAMGNKGQLAFVLLLDVFVALQLILGLAARSARQALPAEQRLPGGWQTGWALPLVIAVGIAAGIKGVDTYHRSSIDNIYRNEDAARQALDRVATCLKQRVENGSGIPASLAALGPAGTKCLDERTAAGTLPGHRLLYWFGAPDSMGKVRLFSLCAEVSNYPKSAWRTYVADESSKATYVEVQEKMRDPYTCSQAWMGDPLRRAKHCIVAYAAKNGSYPRTLEEVGSGATSCLAPSPLDDTRITHSGFKTKDADVSYRPAAADAQGRITAFELHGTQTMYPHRFNIMIDETGAAHAANERDAARNDVAPAEFVKLTEVQQAETKKERELLWTQCDNGGADVCVKLALSEKGGPASSSAEKFWKKGCEHGSELSCVFSARQSDPEVFYLARNDQEDCDAGKPEGCERIKKLARDYRGCNGNEPDGCHGLARRVARGNTQKANAYWDKGCKAGHAESCFFLKIRDFVYINAMNLADACEAGGATQCAALKQQISKLQVQ